MYFTSITIGKDKSIKHDLNRNDDRLLPYFFRNLMISSKLQKPEIEPEDMEQQDKLKRRRKNELKRLKRRHSNVL